MYDIRKTRFYHCAMGSGARLLPATLLVMTSISTAAQAHSPAPPSARTAPADKASSAKATPRLAPTFTLPATDGKAHSLSAYRGRSAVLFFYCGCRWCHQSAQSWSRVQRSGTLSQLGSNSGPSQSRNSKSGTVSKTVPQGGSAPPTLVVYLGDKHEAQEFAGETQMDLKQTVFLIDPDEKVSSLYKAAPCPRVFVVDAQGHMLYTNNEKGADSYKIPAALITARTLDALRAVAAKPTTAKPAVPKPAAAKPTVPRTTKPAAGQKSQKSAAKDISRKQSNE